MAKTQHLAGVLAHKPSGKYYLIHIERLSNQPLFFCFNQFY